MPAVQPSLVTNRLIQRLPRGERLRLLSACEPVTLAFGQILCEPRELLRHVVFPLTAFVSLVTTVGQHPPLEMGLIGSEGLLGATLALGVREAPLRAVVQGSGSALRIGAVAFRREMARSPALTRVLQRYLYVLLGQLAQTAACTRFHEIEPRLSRWLLMTHDRAHADHFSLTHEFLADMLGVRRSGVTVAAGVLQRAGLIRYTRGEIRILDRKGLEAAACECYAVVVREYADMLG